MQKSEREFLDLLRYDPDSVENLVQLGSLYSQEGRYAEAMKIYSRLIELRPEDGEYYNDVGVLLYSMGKDNDAEWMLKKSIELSYEHGDAHINLGRIYLEKVRIADAIEQYWRHFQKFPSDTEMSDERRALFQKLGLSRILIVMEEGIGNMIMLTPALKGLKQLFAEAEITVLGRQPSLQVLEGLNVKTLTEPAEDGLYDICFYTIWGSNYERLYGEKIRGQCTQRAFTVSMDDPDVHEIEQHFKIARFLGYKKDVPETHCPVTEADVPWTTSDRVVALGDTSLDDPAWQRKRWPHYKDLAWELTKKGYEVVLVGGPSEAAQFNPEGWPTVHNLLGRYGLAGTAGILAKCSLFVGNDSGPAHMAAAVGIPTYVIFGATRVSKNRPDGANVTVIEKGLSCSPCQYSPRWESCDRWRCVDEITPQEILRVISGENDFAKMHKDNASSILLSAGDGMGRILIVGVLDVPTSTNVFMKRGFERLGYTVDSYNYRTRARLLGSLTAIQNDFAEFLKGKSYDLILFSKVNGFPPELIDHAKVCGPTWYWFMDNIDVAETMSANEYVKRADFSSATSGEVLEWFQQLSQNAVQVIEGFDPDVYFFEPRPKIHDLLFVGNATPKRIHDLEPIVRNYDFSLFGKGWPESFRAQSPVYNEELRKVINESRIILNLVHGNIFSDRVILTAASGGFVLSQYCSDIASRFRRKVHIDWFEDDDEAKQLIEYYLCHDAERNGIAERGMVHVQRKYQWRAVCEHVMSLAKRTSNPGILRTKSIEVGNRDNDVCCFCGGNLTGPLVKDLLQCDLCGIYRKRVLPSKVSLREQLKDFMLSACSTAEKEKRRLRKADHQLDILEAHIPTGRVFDVGAASGFFMKAARDRGWEAWGNELSVRAIEWAREHYDLDIAYGFMEEIDLPADYFDAVVLWNTLEHTLDPMDTLQLCCRLLRQGGLLLIQVPDRNRDSITQFYEELHTYEFNRNNLPKILENMGCEKLRLESEDDVNPHMTLLFRWKGPHIQSNERIKKVRDSFEMKKRSDSGKTDILRRQLCLKQREDEKTLFVSWHGLGDSVMLMPALRKYREQHPDAYIALAGLQRFGETLKQLLSGLPFIDEVLPCLPDAWNDFSDYRMGVQEVVETGKSVANRKGFQRIVILPTERQDGYKLHKILRFADEVGIKFEYFEELKTELKVSEEAERRVNRFLEKISAPIVVVHAVAGNHPKTLPSDIVRKIVKQFPEHAVLEFGRRSSKRSILIEENDMEFSKALIQRADQVVAIDSVVMHIAGAFSRPCIAIFTVTPVHQAIPITSDKMSIVGLDDATTQLSKWPEYKQQILDRFARKHTQPGRVLITGSGHSGGNWATEIINLSGAFQFTEAVEDRDLFWREFLPERYGTKLATDNIGMYPENLERLLSRYTDLRVVFTLRHPIDTCLSKIFRSTPARENEPVGDMLDYSWDGTVNGSIKSMEQMYTVYSFLKRRYSDRTLFVKLEDLLTDRQKEIERICRFLGIQRNPQMDEAYRFSRNRHHQKRYKGKLDKSQLYIHMQWDKAYNGFFKDKCGVIDRLARGLGSLSSSLGYAEYEYCQRGTTDKIKLPNHYYNPMTYWAHMVTFRCNGRCPFCILQGRGKPQRVKELNGTDIVRFWNNVDHRPGQKLSLIGGEPTLHKDIVEIVNNLEGYDITLTTNCKGPFYSDPRFYEKFRPHSSSNLRINTTFHPHHISAEEYISVIKKYRETGYFVDQTSYVYRPDINKYREAIEKVSQQIPITAAPYLGFYDWQHGFDAPFKPHSIEPNEEYQDLEAAAKICGLTDMEAYRDICGQYEKREVECVHPFLSLIVGPSGDCYHCHYKLYYGIDPVCNINEFRPVDALSKTCRHYGFCNWCDVPRVGCAKNPTSKGIVLNKLYDKREYQRSEIQYLINEIEVFSRTNNLSFNPLKWFEYAYCLLYSGHRHHGNVLDVGSARSVFPYYLASKGYQVTTLDMADSEYRQQMGAKFGVRAVTADLLDYQHNLENRFDLISNLSVVEHIDKDTQAVINLAGYLKPGGIMVISSDFYDTYIEYPDANREIVKDRPEGSHTDSRVYTEGTFMSRIIEPLEKVGLKRLGLTDFKNVDILNSSEKAVRGLYTFGVSCLIKS